jgi:16S rRNA (guanine966-N2)-methyltransferase
MFSIIGAQIIDAHIVDLFAGAGTLGLEALSRGAAHCTFVENGRDALDALRANIEKLGYRNQSTIEAKNATAWASTAPLPPSGLIIFADPPYHQHLAQKTLDALAANPALSPDLLLILQCGKRDEVSETAGPLTLSRTEKYGETIVHFFL